MMAKTCKVQTQTNAAAKAGTKAKRTGPNHPPNAPPLPTIFCPFGQATFTVVVIVAIPALVIVVASAPNARYRSVCMRVCMHRKKITKIKSKIKHYRVSDKYALQSLITAYLSTWS